MTSSELNMALISLKRRENREIASQNMECYLGRYNLSEDERQAIVDEDWVAMWHCGASPYAINKLRHMRLLSHDDLAPIWRGMSRVEWESFQAEQAARNARFALAPEDTQWQR